MERLILIAVFTDAVILLFVLIVFFRTAGRIRDILEIMRRHVGESSDIPPNPKGGAASENIQTPNLPVEPPISIDGVDGGEMPIVTQLETNKEHIIKINIDGYKPFVISIHPSYGGWLSKGVAFGDSVTLAIDSFLGDVYWLDWDQTTEVMKTMGINVSKPNNSLYLFYSTEPNDGWKKFAQLDTVI